MDIYCFLNKLKSYASKGFFLFICFFIDNFALAETSIFKLGVEDLDYYPFYSTFQFSGLKDQKLHGAGSEIIYLFAKKNKEKFQFQYMPFPVFRLFKEFVEGGVDFKFPDNPNWQVELKAPYDVVYSKAVLRYTDGTLILPKNKSKGLNGIKRLGTVKGFTPWDYLSLIKQHKIILEESLTTKSLLEKAINEHIDAVYINVDIAQFLLTKMGKTGELIYDPNLPKTTDYYYLSTINFPDIKNNFNEFLVTEKEAISKILEKYKLSY